MKFLYRFLRCAMFLAVMVVWTMPAMAQHPFTLTTADDVTNHTEKLYWIESFGATGFYMISHTDNQSVSTTNMPNLKALWYFMDAGKEGNTQYYYIVNHNTGNYLKLDGSNGSDNTIKIASFGSGGDSFKFFIDGNEGQWIFRTKSGGNSYWVNKKSGNVPYDRYLKSSNYGGSPDENSKWNFVAENSVTWAHPFTNSTNSEKHYYYFNNAPSNGSAYYLSTDDDSDPYATVSSVDNGKRMWYFVEAASDNTIPNLKYYYIVNAITGKYLKFTGTANGNSQASSLQLYAHTGTETGETENRFQFMVLNAKGNTDSAYSIMPKLEINYYYNQNTSLSPTDSYGNTLSDDMKIGIYNDRGQDNNYAHWKINIALADPVIICDGDFITITCETNDVSIYYRLAQAGEFSSYSTPIAINETTVIEAYAVKNEVQSNIVIEDCIAIKSYKFAGLEITHGPLYYGNNGYEIKDGWNYDSYNSVYGKTVGSTYFNFIELGQLFESSVFSISDGDIEKVLDPLNGWRVPTNAEWASILGTTRSGSTVNGSSSKHYAMIQLSGVSGLLIFPDGETITGVALANMDNTTPNDITESDLNEYLGQGCVFMPGSGYYNGSWNDGNYYWSSTENDSSTGYVSSGDSKDKESYYLPVYLVKGAADEATRLLKTWTYNGNEVELPYSVNAIDGHSSSYAKGTFNFTTDIKVKELQPTYLWFQHADQSAEVYVNNTFVEKHWGGYNAFFVDITNHVHLGTNNIKVAIKNNEGTKLAPCAGDFNFNATLGEVKLISSPVVPSPDYGYDGFHITSTVSEEEATITVKTKVPTGATLTCSINGTNCDYSSTQTSTGEETTFTKTITDPHLWNGTLDPYLYDVTLSIAKDGVVYHTFKRGYGLRFYEYAVDTEHPENSRFLLNGSPYLLRGVCMHSDLEGKANALTAEDIDNDFELLKDLGCNFIRLAHYPHPKEVYDWCDKLGIIVQTEAPWVNNAQSTQPSDYYTHLEGQYEDMVNQHYNHPSILFWGLSNETTTDDKEFAKEKIEYYTQLIKDLDSSRLVGYVMSHSVDNPGGYYNDPDVDWFGCNIYSGWYIDQNSNDPTSRLTTRLTKTLTRLSKPLAFSEYGCGGTPSCHSDDFMTTTTRGNNPRHDIEYQMWLHEGHIAAIKNFPQLLFTSQWQLFDIAVSNRTEGYKVCKDGEESSVFDNDELMRLNNKGLVERDHKTKKDTYYLYKAWWNQTDKFVHICGKDYKKLTDRVIKCYTNDGSTLKLYINNEEIETATVTNNIATFTARNFNPGDVIRVAGDNSDDSFTITNYNIFTTEGNWNEASNWSVNAVPTAGCDVDILANATVPSGCTANVGNVTLYGGSTLTIADGGQLVSNSAVNATVEKDITAYTITQTSGEDKSNGWYFIASPVTDDYTPTGSMVENTYDLYRLNNTTWENYKNTTDHPDFTTLNNGEGYLYANSGNVTLQFTGTLKPYAVNESVNVSTGWNLIGNPFAYNVYANRSFYKINNDKTGIEAVSAFSTTPIAPCTGILVEAETDDNVIFSKEPPTQSQGGNGSLQIALNQANTRDNAMLDKVIVSFNEDSQLGKFYFGTQSANIYIKQGADEYAIVSVDKDVTWHVSTMDVNFKANKNGQYTISINPENVEMNYLHLIDNITGADVDLLQTPEYSFNAMTTDYESRFKLIFLCGDATDDNETFAFINNGDIIIKGQGELQVFDVMGRLVTKRYINGVETQNFVSLPTTGVYIFKLNEKTQKIVVR